MHRAMKIGLTMFEIALMSGMTALFNWPAGSAPLPIPNMILMFLWGTVVTKAIIELIEDD